MNKKGFSLIELIISVGIVVVLVGGATLYFPKLSSEAEVNALKANLSTIRKVIDDFYGDFGRYPSSLEELVTETPGGYIYLHKIPPDPTTKSINWEVSKDGENYYYFNEADIEYIRYIRSGNSKYKDL
ncbi:MAG: type II secretion system protein [Candidatus Muiribacteriota bacterium]